MNGIEERLAEVLRRHMYESVHDADFPDGLDEPSLGFQRDPDVAKWSEMVAKAVVAELGFTEQWMARHESGGGRVFDSGDAARRFLANFVERLPGVEDEGSGSFTGLESRYVSKWEPAL